jgi:hypothetical protein
MWRNLVVKFRHILVGRATSGCHMRWVPHRLAAAAGLAPDVKFRGVVKYQLDANNTPMVAHRGCINQTVALRMSLIGLNGCSACVTLKVLDFSSERTNAARATNDQYNRNNP